MYSVYICATTDIVTVLGLVGGAPGGTWGETTRAAKMLVSYMALARMLFGSHALHTPHAWS